MVIFALATCATGLWAGPREADTLLVFRPSSKYFDDAYNGITAALEGSLNLRKYIVDGNTSPDDIGDQIDRIQPSMVVLMENTTVALYRNYQRKQSDDHSFPPAIVLMTLYVDSYLPNLKNTMGIAYEVPGITSLLHLRALVQAPIRRVGAVYSSKLESFFLDQKKDCLAEDIVLVGSRLEKEDLEPRTIKKALQQLLRKEKIDALWILNDSTVLTDKNVRRAWVPVLQRCRKPILVSVRNLIELGHFGVFPDHYSMGEQAADIVLETRESNWQLRGSNLRPPSSVLKIVNKLKAEPAKIKLNEEVLLEMDDIIE
ncbi:MAG: hypothetical protein QNK37_08595 [Acidobacteriota bacterium]|nr:hypothetical protein [Acidobacteriota bacterium]